MYHQAVTSILGNGYQRQVFLLATHKLPRRRERKKLHFMYRMQFMYKTPSVYMPRPPVSTHAVYQPSPFYSKHRPPTPATSHAKSW